LGASGGRRVVEFCVCVWGIFVFAVVFVAVLRWMMIVGLLPFLLFFFFFFFFFLAALVEFWVC